MTHQSERHQVLYEWADNNCFSILALGKVKVTFLKFAGVSVEWCEARKLYFL